VFEEILGIPAHPLIIHAAVVFVPMMIAVAFAYTLLPRARRALGWLVWILAVLGPLSMLLAKLSGDAFRARLVRRGTAGSALLARIDQHRSLANTTAWVTLAFGVAVAMTLVLYRRAAAATADAAPRRAGGGLTPAGGSMPINLIVLLVMVALGLATGYYIFRTGDSGAHVAWTGM
jgi:hypothetical protein